MFILDPRQRIGTGELWSMIDSLKEEVVKNKYQTIVRQDDKKPFANSLRNPQIMREPMVLSQPQSYYKPAVSAKPPTVPNI